MPENTGGLSVSGYLDCHTQVCPYNFYCLGLEVADAVMLLFNELFVNNFPELQHGGKLHPVQFISAALIITSYNTVLRDVTTRKFIVVKVMNTVESANI